MPLCQECNGIYASNAGLARHVNSQHHPTKHYECRCGRVFLDPAARSRCRTGHSKSFECPVEDCAYKSSRKDSAKDHMRRRHKNLRGLQISTVPLDDGYAEGASSPGLEISSAPIALDLISPAHFMITPELDASFSPFSQSPSYYPEGSPVSWTTSG